MFNETDHRGLVDINSFLCQSYSEFEDCCRSLLEQAGYGKVSVTKKGPKGGDGGIDLDIQSADGTLIACGQCKCWKGRYDGLMKPLRELYGSMKLRGVSRGVFLITVDATPEEKRDAKLLNIELIDAAELLKLARQEQALNKEAESEDGKNRFISFLKSAGKIIFALIGLLLAGAGFVVLGLLLFLMLAAASMAENNSHRRYSHYYRTRRYSRSKWSYRRHYRHRDAVWPY